MTQFDLSHEEQAGQLVLTVLEPELRFEKSEVFKRLVTDHIENGSTNVVIDLSRVEFLDSMALSAFIAANNRLDSSGRRLTLCGLQPKVANVLKLTSLDKHFTIRPTLAEALS